MSYNVSKSFPCGMFLTWLGTSRRPIDFQVSREDQKAIREILRPALKLTAQERISAPAELRRRLGVGPGTFGNCALVSPTPWRWKRPGVWITRRGERPAERLTLDA
jgi:hypothetical protein